MLASRAGPDRSWDPHEPGEQVAVFAPGGDTRQGLVMGAVYCDAHPANGAAAGVHRRDYADGAFVEYDRASGAMTIRALGDVTIRAGGTVRIEAAAIEHRGIDIGWTHTHSGVSAGLARTGDPQ
jgi:phage baseplate assembly protein V